MNLIRTAAWLCAASLLVSGDGQLRHNAARPIKSEAQAPNRSLRGDNRPPTDQEWSNVLQWMQQHSPNRLKFLQKQMNANQAQQAQQLIWNEYRVLQAVNYRPLKEAMVAQAEAQDQVFGAQIALRGAQQSHNADQQEAARNQLKTAVEHLVDGQQSVIRVRIEKLQGDLDRLKENHDKRVTQIYRQKLQQINGLVTRDADRPPDEDQPQD